MIHSMVSACFMFLSQARKICCEWGVYVVGAQLRSQAHTSASLTHGTKKLFFFIIQNETNLRLTGIELMHCGLVRYPYAKTKGDEETA